MTSTTSETSEPTSRAPESHMISSFNPHKFAMSSFVHALVVDLGDHDLDADFDICNNLRHCDNE